MPTARYCKPMLSDVTPVGVKMALSFVITLDNRIYR